MRPPILPLARTIPFIVAGLTCGCVLASTAPQGSLLDRAIVVAGGPEALQHAERLIWDGEAVVHVQGRDIVLGVHSDIVPFGKVRSESWLAEKGPSTMRVLVLDGRQGWGIRNGQREELPPEIIANEYAQFGAYGLMRLVSLRDSGATVHETDPDETGLRGLRVQYPGIPEATLWFDKGARLAALTNTAPSPTGGPPIQQRFEFEGSVESKGIRWPQKITISQDGKPFFELRITKFEARARE